ncbi:MAG: SDR family oxidoreductase [Chitinophagaceae bacterium]|nr:SDR family oxidoreductase [Chitinophagaceae bacterium]
MIIENKIALVTGGSRGLGKDMALQLARNGHDVVLTYQSREDAALEVVNEIVAMGKNAAALSLDTNDVASLPDFVKTFLRLLQSKWKKQTFDFLINNAGVGATIPFAQATEADFDRLMNIHFKSVYFLTQQLLPLVNDGGRIINISTGTTRFCVPGYSIYSSMKGAVEVFTRYLAKETGPRKITVNVVAPGPVATDFNNGGNRDNPERNKMLASQTALGRVGEAKDIGGIIAFLCSEEGGWINGQRIEVTGGINL